MSDEKRYVPVPNGGSIGIMPGYVDARTGGAAEWKPPLKIGAQIAQEPRQESILEHLKFQREKIKHAQEAAMRNAFTWQSHADIEAQRLRDVDTAIAALTPAPEPAEKETLEREIPEGWTAWDGRPEYPPGVDANTSVETRASEGFLTYPGSPPNAEAWEYVGAYRIIEAPAQASSTELRSVPGAEEVVRDQIEIPEGFLPWTGGHPANAGITYDMVVEIITRNGDRDTKQAGMVHRFWWEEGMPGYDVVAYRIIEPARTDDDTPPEHTSDLTGDPAIEPENGLHDYGFAEHAEAERRAEGWIPAEEFSFPAREAIVEARWDDGYCERLTFAGYTPTTHEPEWRSESGREQTEEDCTVTHYRAFPQPDPPALNDAMQDEREEGYQHVVAVDDAPPTQEGFQQRATDPDADFWARGLTEKPKQRLNIFGIDFSGKPKVDA